MNPDRIDLIAVAQQACGIAPAPVMECADESAALAAELRQRTKERDAWATHCQRAEADAAALLVERDRLQARVDALDMRSLIGELREIYNALPDNADVSGRALCDLLRRIDRESNQQPTGENQ